MDIRKKKIEELNEVLEYFFETNEIDEIKKGEINENK